LPDAERLCGRLLFGMTKGRQHLDESALALGTAREAGLSPQA
jgi:hypothetical protein